MRAVLPFLAFALTATTFAGCLDSGEAMSADRPAWQSGYSFSYEVTGHRKFSEIREGGGEKVNEHQERPIGPDIQRIEVVNTGYENGDVPVYLAVGSRAAKDAPQPQQVQVGDESVVMPSMTSAYLQAFRQRDLAGVGVMSGVQRQCDEDGCTTALGKVTFTSDPKHTYLDFPLSKGKTWSGTSETDDSGSPFHWAINAKAGGAAWIDLIPGRVRTIPVDFTFTPVNLEKALQEAREEEDLDRLDYRPTMHLKVYYAPDYQTVVRSEYLEKYDGYASGRDDGESFTSEGHGEVYVVTALTGAKLVAKPERDAGYIARVLSGEIAINDPTGQAQKPVGYTVALEASETKVNAAQTPVVKFGGRIGGDASAFAGHKAKWTIVDFAGKEVAQGEGLSFSHEFAEPGYYTAEIETIDGGGRTAAASSAFVVANYESKVDEACPPIALSPLLPGCPAIDVPVRAGIQRLTVTAVPSSPAPFLNDGELELLDAQGHGATDDTASGPEYRILVDDFKDWATDAGDWQLQFRQNRAVLEQSVEYSVVLEYGPDLPTIISATMADAGLAGTSIGGPKLGWI